MKRFDEYESLENIIARLPREGLLSKSSARFRRLSTSLKSTDSSLKAPIVERSTKKWNSKTTDESNISRMPCSNASLFEAPLDTAVKQNDSAFKLNSVKKESRTLSTSTTGMNSSRIRDPSVRLALDRFKANRRSIAVVRTEGKISPASIIPMRSLSLKKRKPKDQFNCKSPQEFDRNLLFRNQNSSQKRNTEINKYKNCQRSLHFTKVREEFSEDDTKPLPSIQDVSDSDGSMITDRRQCDSNVACADKENFPPPKEEYLKTKEIFRLKYRRRSSNLRSKTSIPIWQPFKESATKRRELKKISEEFTKRLDENDESFIEKEIDLNSLEKENKIACTKSSSPNCTPVKSLPTRKKNPEKRLSNFTSSTVTSSIETVSADVNSVQPSCPPNSPASNSLEPKNSEAFPVSSNSEAKKCYKDASTNTTPPTDHFQSSSIDFESLIQKSVTDYQQLMRSFESLVQETNQEFVRRSEILLSDYKASFGNLIDLGKQFQNSLKLNDKTKKESESVTNESSDHEVKKDFPPIDCPFTGSCPPVPEKTKLRRSFSHPPSVSPHEKFVSDHVGGSLFTNCVGDCERERPSLVPMTPRTRHSYFDLKEAFNQQLDDLY